MTDLENSRKEIDEADSRLIELLSGRMKISEDIAKFKIEKKMKVFDASREEKILSKVRDMAPDGFKDEITGIFDGIMTMSKLHQYKLTGGNQGMLDSVYDALTYEHFSPSPESVRVGVRTSDGEQAVSAVRMMYPSARAVKFDGHREMLAQLSLRNIDYCILPCSADSDIPVSILYQAVAENNAFINKTYNASNSYSLLAKPSSRRITGIVSSADVLAGCSEFIEKYDLSATVAGSALASAQRVAGASRIDIGTIGDETLAKSLGLKVVASNIQNKNAGSVKFVSIAPELEAPLDADRIIIKFSLADISGSLPRVLSYFSASGVRIIALESGQMSKNKFYLELEGTLTNEKLLILLSALSEELSDFALLGYYCDGNLENE